MHAVFLVAQMQLDGKATLGEAPSGERTSAAGSAA
jgi:hypothetical protein